MLRPIHAVLPTLPLFLSAAFATPSAEIPSLADRDTLSYGAVCAQIRQSVSDATDVYDPASLHYIQDTAHWASSSSDTSACSVEPGSGDDIAKILQIVGNSSTPFAVKGGGHASNPGFSSTKGVHISMTRFNSVVYDSEAQTVTFGAGLIWDDVYKALEPYDVNVVGGRVSGVGVAGFTIGGGYSWLTKQHGLTIDTVTQFELVKPTGEFTNVTSSSDPDLFFALRGGGNNFGIVTRFTLKTFSQGEVWGGLITITEDQLDEVIAATAKFSSSVTDPKAAIITTLNGLVGFPGVSQLLFYDGPTPPSGIFDNFLDIPYFTKDVKTRSFLDLVQASPSNATTGQRAAFDTVPVTEYSPEFLDAVVNQTKYWGANLLLASATFVSFDIEPFLPSSLSHSPSGSAYPSSRSQVYLPTNLYFAWTNPLFDDTVINAIQESKRVLRDKAIQLGQDVQDAPSYSNYAIYTTPLAELYGSNLARLQQLKAKYDPNKVMRLAGGFKL